MSEKSAPEFLGLSPAEEYLRIFVNIIELPGGIDNIKSVAGLAQTGPVSTHAHQAKIYESQSTILDCTPRSLDYGCLCDFIFLRNGSLRKWNN